MRRVIDDVALQYHLMRAHDRRRRFAVSRRLGVRRAWRSGWDPAHLSGRRHNGTQPRRVGSRHSHTAVTVHTSAGSHATRAGSRNAAEMQPIAIITVANCFARSGTARRARQSRRIGPKRACSSIQRSQRSLLRAKQNAASRTNGVVGSKGTTTPMSPTTSANAPAKPQATRSQRRRDGGSAARAARRKAKPLSPLAPRARFSMAVNECQSADMISADDTQDQEPTLVAFDGRCFSSAAQTLARRSDAFLLIRMRRWERCLDAGTT